MDVDVKPLYPVSHWDFKAEKQ